MQCGGCGQGRGKATFTNGITGVAAYVVLTILCLEHSTGVTLLLPGPCAAATDDLTVAITGGVGSHVIHQHLNDSRVNIFPPATLGAIFYKFLNCKFTII